MTTALSALDFLLPWDFSPTAFLVIGLAAVLFTVGARRTPARTPTGRRVAFYVALALIYCALQTKWDFYAGHMFFVHRLQHFALHDVGPYLGMRILILTVVMVPMIVVGAVIGLSRHDLYPVYQICGRFFPLSPVTDQQIGGLIIWIPGSFLAVIAALLALSRAMHQSPARDRARPQAIGSARPS